MAALSMVLLILGTGGVLLGLGWLITDGVATRNIKPGLAGIVLIGVGLSIPVGDSAMSNTETQQSTPKSNAEQPPSEATPDLQLLSWSTVSTRMQFACATNQKGIASCWGAPVEIGDKPVVQIAFGREHGCALRTTGQVECWGGAKPENQGLRQQRFTAIASTLETTCGLTKEGKIKCWGDPNGTPPSETGFKAISGGAAHFCALTINGEPRCWGDNQEGQSTPVDGPYTSISAGHFHSCGIRTDSTAQCWGRNKEGQSSPPQTRFRQISSGWSHTCGIDQTGSLECWGCGHNANAMTQESTDACHPPMDRVIAVSAGDLWQSCAIKSSGETTCWGDLPYKGESQ